jgi:hypothetical protein
MKALILAVLMVLVAQVAQAQCVKHTPYARFGERVQLAQPGETVFNDFVLRNTDTCECPKTCFILSPGWRPPHDSSAGLRVVFGSVKLRTLRGDPLPSVCLYPGEEVNGIYRLTLSEHQDTSGYVMPGVFIARQHFEWNDFDTFDLEGGMICSGYEYFQCREFTYDPTPPQ